MTSDPWLARHFDENRPLLRAVALRILGSAADAEDALQEAWLKSGGARGEIENPRAWLTTIVARVCLDMLRARRSSPATDGIDDLAATARDPSQPIDDELGLAEEIGQALFVVLQTLAPGERVAFVLHDVFDLSFDDIATVVGRSPAAARQLASRGRRRVRGAAEPIVDRERRKEIFDAFLAASRDGDLDALVGMLAPDATFCADALAVRVAEENRWLGAQTLRREVRGGAAVADAFKGRARGVTPVWIDDEAGAAWILGDRVQSAFVFTLDGDKIAGIDLVMEPVDLEGLVIQRC